MIPIIIVSVTVGLVAGLTAALVSSRRRTATQQSVQQQAIAAAVAQVLVEREATAVVVGEDRERVVEAAVTNAVQVAGATLDAKLAASSSELDLRSQSFEQRAAAIDEQLRLMGEKVEGMRRQSTSQLSSLTTELKAAGEHHRELHQTTAQLRDALASPKRRGQWGERMAEDVLVAAGFVEGVNYCRQRQMATGGIPDLTFFLPGGMVMNMDVKFPVDNYLKFLEASDETAADAARRQFSRDVRARVREIADRGYVDAETTVDSVLLFIPNESVYAFLHENDPDLVDQALAQKVVLCSPFTLFAVLAVIRQAVDQFRLEKTSDQILVELGRVEGEWKKFSDQVTKVGKHLGTLTNSFGELSAARTNQMGRAFKRIDDLRADRSLDPDSSAASVAPDPTPAADDPAVEPLFGRDDLSELRDAG
ncbi:MAG: DNA recombination protein RmuC [Acidimicrobiales bacterium]